MTNKSISERNASDDLIRFFSVFLVIMVHADNQPWSGIPILSALIRMILLFSNSFFYMLSGKYNIGIEFNEAGDYLKYYKKKFVNIVFPYVFVSILLSIWNLRKIPNLDFGSTPVALYYLKSSLKDLISSNSSTHLWFMFGLIGYLLSAPFLSKMFHAMSNIELHILYGIIIIWNTITVLIFPFFNEPFGYHGWFLTGWMIHFCLGYYVDRAVTSSNAKLFYVMGICGAFINVMGATFFADRFSNPNDLAPTFIITCVGVMAFLQRKLNVSDERLKRITRFMSGYYFYIYMVHFNILKYITPNITNAIPKGLRFIPDVMVTFCISFVCSIILKIVITPCSNLLKKIL